MHRGRLRVLLLPFILIFGAKLNASEPVRILSIDGGGVRGIIAAVILEELEKESGRPVAEIFDLVAGTSTGGIIALAMTAPDNNKKPRFLAQQVVDLYIDESANIFSASMSHWITNMGGLLGPKYESTALADILERYLGDTKMSEAVKPTLITGYHVDGQTGVEFFSEDARMFASDKDCLMREVGLATAAAPVYFDSADVEFSWGILESVADGGLYKHNPALLAYVNAKDLFPGRKIEIYSLGTGKMSAEDLSMELKGRGLLQWLQPIIRHIQIGGSEGDNAVLSRLLNTDGEENYFRLNVRIDADHGAMDNTSAENLSYLYEKGLEATTSHMFKQMIARLKK